MDVEVEDNEKTASVGRSWIMGSKFEAKMPHHQGIKALWETKWKFPCTISVYPFHDGKFEDFAPVFEELIAVSDTWLLDEIQNLSY